ncbi:MAG: hypothetical protein HY717_00750 [Planctomycetes bacterium]|nr:hypothetical protein [Planctomycetota bacterium]
MTILSSISIFLTLVLLTSEKGLLEDYRREESSFGVLYHRGWGPSSARGPALQVENSLRGVEGRLQRRHCGEMTVVLVPNYPEFSRLVVAITGKEPPRWVVGMAFPDRAWLLVRGDSPPVGLHPWDQPEVSLAHELTHLVIHRKKEITIPHWFDEGLCLWVSGQKISSEDEAWICGLARLGGLFQVKDLENRFPALHQPGTTAYHQSLFMILYLKEKFGETVIPQLLDGLEAGKPFPDQYKILTGREWNAFEADFRLWMMARRSLLEVLALALNPWTAITLLAIVAMASSALRRRKLRRRLEEEEKIVDPEPEV